MSKYDFTIEKPQMSDYGITEHELEEYRKWERCRYPERFYTKSFYEKRCEKIAIAFGVMCGISVVLLIVFFATDLTSLGVVFSVLGLVFMFAGFIFFQLGEEIADRMCDRGEEDALPDGLQSRFAHNGKVRQIQRRDVVV